MIQQLLVLLIFTAAVAYLGYTLYKTFNAKEADCSGTCGCSKMDLKKLEEEMKKSIEIKP